MRELNSRSKFKDNSENTQNSQRAVQKPKTEENKGFITGIPLLDNLLSDKDAVIIIGLLLILMSENTDKTLLFALIYILL